MIQQQRYLWPIDCPDELTDVPRCWNASLNLGNEKHNDNVGTRSFAVWVSNNKESSETSWYLLSPEWEVAIELCHGTWISWNGKICGHCLAIPNLAGGVQLLSLFCSIPQNLCDHLEQQLMIKSREKLEQQLLLKTCLNFRGRINRNEILHFISIISVIVIVIINISQADRNGMGGIAWSQITETNLFCAI
jgi:hypothetical protein